VDGVLNTSQKVIDFCKLHNIDKKHAFYSGLCIEEMAGNIIKHGFKTTNNKVKNSVDICVVYKDGGILMRLKDNCSPFNPKEREAIFKPGDDVTSNIGIRMIERISKRMEYQFVLGLNVLSVWI
jgi:anti-sigma regulatory factor (Ser/Thr protein kinase)